ncbi:MAG: Flp pilus assembly protein CpaB [Novosphingobium sp.]|nr:Flp pilus assembly protein CpaB [Novosphingobium sp.]
MDKKKLMLLLGAMVIAIGTALAARSMFTGASAPKAEAAQLVPKGPKVLVAQRALPVGTIITADAISFHDWPKGMVQDAYFVEGEADMKKLLGTVVRYPITAGQPVTQGALVAPGDRGFLAAALGPGMRAVTITVSVQSGVAGFIFPGDHVDLMLTQSVKGEGESLNTTETILRNLRVLATDQSTESETANGKTVVHEFRSVTLEVTPRIGEKIQVAQTIGTLSLALRSLSDNQSELEHAIANGSIKIPDGASKADEDKLLASAGNRPQDGATSFVTGGDVSRFQRRTVPPKQGSMAGQAMAMLASAAAAHGGGPGAAATETVLRGPVVRVIRGKDVTAVMVGKN